MENKDNEVGKVVRINKEIVYLEGKPIERIVITNFVLGD